jgi:hypothetical protein
MVIELDFTPESMAVKRNKNSSGINSPPSKFVAIFYVLAK